MMNDRSKKDAAEMVALAKKYARKFGGVGLHSPEDIAQAALVKWFREKKGVAACADWMYKVVRSVFYDAGRFDGRENRNRLTWLDQGCDLGEEPPSFSDLIDRVCVVKESSVEFDVMPQIERQLKKLKPNIMRALVLSAEGYSYEEIAKLTGANIGTVKSRIHYARKKAAEKLAHLR